MTPRDRAEKIVERFLSTPEGFAPDDKQALIAAIEQGMNAALVDGEQFDGEYRIGDTILIEAKVSQIWEGEAVAIEDDWGELCIVKHDSIRALKSPDTPRNTITDNQKD